MTPNDAQTKFSSGGAKKRDLARDNRAAQTVAVVKQCVPLTETGGVGVVGRSIAARP
jgi:hypothetical protein